MKSLLPPPPLSLPTTTPCLLPLPPVHMDECLQWFDGDGVEQVQPLPLDPYNGVISAQITSDAQQALDSLLAKIKQNAIDVLALDSDGNISVFPENCILPPPPCSVYHIPGGTNGVPAGTDVTVIGCTKEFISSDILRRLEDAIADTELTLDAMPALHAGGLQLLPEPARPVYKFNGVDQLRTLPAPPIAALANVVVDAAQFVGTSDAISVGYKADYVSLTETAKQIVDTTRTQLRLFDTPLPPAPPEPDGVTDWYHTEQRPCRNGIYEVQQTFGEIHRLYYHTKKDQWYYVADDNTSMGTSCCAGDSLHIIACGWRGRTGPAEA